MRNLRLTTHRMSWFLSCSDRPWGERGQNLRSWRRTHDPQTQQGPPCRHQQQQQQQQQAAHKKEPTFQGMSPRQNRHSSGNMHAFLSLAAICKCTPSVESSSCTFGRVTSPPHHLGGNRRKQGLLTAPCSPANGVAAGDDSRLSGWLYSLPWGLGQAKEAMNPPQHVM
jgi:hypothetical protein